MLLRAFGNLSLAWGTKHFPETLAANPLSYLRAMVSPLVAVGLGVAVGVGITIGVAVGVAVGVTVGVSVGEYAIAAATAE